MSHTAAVETEGSSRSRALRISLIAHALGYEVTLTPVGSSPIANILSGSGKAARVYRRSPPSGC
ncbi:unnamed protein product [Brassica oleracea]